MRSTEVRSITRALRIFEEFASRQSSLTLSELARSAEVPISTCFAICRTMERCGYIFSAKGNGRYYPTGRLFIVAEKIAQGDAASEVFRPVLQQISMFSQETAVLGVLSGDHVVIQQKHESTNVLRYCVQVGDRRPLIGTSMGKALLSQLPEAERTRILDAADMRWIVPRGVFEEQLAKEALRGYFMNDNLTVPGVATIAVPVTVIGTIFAICIAGPAERIRAHMPVFAARLVAIKTALET